MKEYQEPKLLICRFADGTLVGTDIFSTSVEVLSEDHEKVDTFDVGAWLGN